MRQALHRRWAGMLLVICAAFMLMGAGSDTKSRFDKLGHNLMCMCGCGQILLECNHVGCTYSEGMRKELSASLERGDSDKAVLDGFVAKYGATVLSAPTTTGFNRVAWIMPVVIFFAALGAVVVVVRNWKLREAARAAVATPAGDATQPINEYQRRAREETEL